MPRFSASSGRQNLVTLKQKKKSLADAVNEQLTASAFGGGGDKWDAADYAEGGVAEDFDFDDRDSHSGSSAGGDYDDGAGGYGASKSRRVTAAGAKGATKGSKKSPGATAAGGARGLAAAASSSSRLRHRGPLDASLSEGKYAAAPVNVEAAMDDIFGALDMGDMDAEGEEFFDGDMEGGADDDFSGEEGSDVDADDSDFAWEGEEGESDEDAQRTGRGAAKKGKKGKATAESATSRKRRRAKDLTEDEYTAWLEQKRLKEKKSGKLRRPLSFGGGAEGVDDAAMNSEEADILRQLNELRQAQHVSLVPSADSAAGGDASASSAAAAQSDAKTTRDTVQHFIMVYGQLLRLRVLLQPAVTRAISLPQYYAKSLFVRRDAAVEKAAAQEEGGGEAAAHAIETLTEQREAAAEKYEELQEDLESVLTTLYEAATGHSARGRAAGGQEEEDGDEDGDGVHASSRSAKRAKTEVPSYRAVEKYHERVLRHADSCLEYWGSKLVQANSAKLKTIAQPLPQQIAAILTARSRLRTKVQKNRSHLAILAHPEHVRATTSAEAKAQRALHMAEGDVDHEIYDDADFLRELVRRGGAVANQLEQKVKDMQQALLPSKEGARKGFHRMTKGKAVNYEPRPKLVGFMMAESLDDTQRNDVVVKSLFQ